MLTTLGMTRSTAATVPSRRASASTAPRTGRDRTRQSVSDAATRLGPGNNFHTFITRNSLHSVRLTLQKLQSKSNGKVSSNSSNLYAEWRAQAPATLALRETAEPVPPE